MELTERKLKILQAIIDDYVETAEPVGSRTLAKEFNNQISSATIRNEMSDLEDMGYLTHPHTSAGRVPSDKAYRLYVNSIMRPVKVTSPETQERVRQQLRKDADEFDKTIRHAAKLLSEMTNLASFVMTPRQEEDRLRYVNVLPVDEQTVILTIVADSGKTQNTLLHLNQPYTEDMLRILRKHLTVDYQGKEITEVLRNSIIDDFETDVTAMGGLTKNVMPNFMRSLEDMLDVHLYMEGLSTIFDIPEFTDLSRAKSFITLLDRREELLQALLDRDDGMVVTIGQENPEEDMKDCSLITATYHVNGRYVGKLGVIGPTRMPYEKITSVVQYMTDNLNEAFKLRSGREDEKEDD